MSEHEAREIWKAFQPDEGVPACNSFQTRAFLQAAMMGWAEASASMRWFEAILMASLKPSATLASLMLKLAAEGLKMYYQQHIKGEQPLYITARVAIVQQNRPYFTSIAQGMEF